VVIFQHGRSDSYRVATVPSNYDDNKTADGRAKVFPTCTHMFTYFFVGSPLLFVSPCASE
jgi:hypothetical protein